MYWPGPPEGTLTSSCAYDGAKPDDLLGSTATHWAPPSHDALDSDRVWWCSQFADGTRSYRPSSATKWPSMLGKVVASQGPTSGFLVVCSPRTLWLDRAEMPLRFRFHQWGFRDVSSLEIASVAFRNARVFVVLLQKWFSYLKVLSLKSLRFLEDFGGIAEHGMDNATADPQLPSFHLLNRLEVSNKNALVSKPGSQTHLAAIH